MTFRERLADWISGGALSREMCRTNMFRDLFHKYGDISTKYSFALRQIAEQETPTANATVKRMARIAREALK